MVEHVQQTSDSHVHSFVLILILFLILPEKLHLSLAWLSRGLMSDSIHANTTPGTGG